MEREGNGHQSLNLKSWLYTVYVIKLVMSSQLIFVCMLG
jgi:hypothetical protein